ncbi:MAG: FG-GAP-like repeat-containing protein [Ferruginibacter sp.]
MKYSFLPASLRIIIIASCLFFSVQALAQPTIFSFAPATGPVGTSVIITGNNFNTTAANDIVYFGAVKANVTSASATSLTVTAPAGATYQPITVLDNSTGLMAYSPKPFIITFANPIGTGIPANFYKPKVDFTVGSIPRNVATNDLDGDGKPDLVSANSSSGTLSVLRNISNPGSISASSLATKVDFASGSFTEHVSIGDVDGDAKPDLVVVTNANISVLRNISTAGSITATSFAAKVDFTSSSTGPVFGALGDVDGDGKPDIVTANPSANTVSVRRNLTTTPGSISFATKVDFSTGSTPFSVAIGDVDGDGKPDLVVTNSAVGINTVSVLRNTSIPGTISFATKVDFTTGAIPRSVAIGDIDGDGKPDLVVANNATSPASTTISVLYNTSIMGSITASSFAAKVDFTAGTVPRSITIGDLDGDGKPDVVVTNMNSNNISVLRNTSTPGSITASSFASKVDFTTGASPVSAVIVDVEGDGIPEIAVANSAIIAGSLGLSVFQIDLAAVPVVLSNVKAFQKNAGVQVEWTTEQEINILSYEVERSQNGQQFDKLETVTAIGSSSTATHYNIFDPHPFNGLNFYRVKIIEANKIAYSQVLKINNISEAKSSMNIYPNPVIGNNITVHWNLPKGNYMLMITNNVGQVMLKKLINHSGGAATESFIMTKQFLPGYYLVKLSGEGASFKNTIIKN